MTRDTRERLKDIAEALAAIRHYVGGSLEQPVISDAVVLDAVLFRLSVIGEAAKNIDDEPGSAPSTVRWSDYAGLRDVIAHQYFRIQKQIIEDTVRKDLPVLSVAVDGLLS